MMNPPKHLIDWIRWDDETPGLPSIVAAFRGLTRDILVLAPTNTAGYTITIPKITETTWQYRTWTDIANLTGTCPQKSNGPLGTIVLLRSLTGLWEVRRFRDRYEVRRTEGRARKIVAVFDADTVPDGVQAQYKAAVTFAVTRSNTARKCMLCPKDLSDTMGCHVFVANEELMPQKELSICVDCYTARGGNVFTADELPTD